MPINNHKKKTGGKHLAEKSSGLGSFLKPKKKPPVKKYQEIEREDYPELELEGIDFSDIGDAAAVETEQLAVIEEQPAVLEEHPEAAEEPQENPQEEPADEPGAEPEQEEVPAEETDELSSEDVSEELPAETENQTLDDDFPMAEEDTEEEPPKPPEKAEKRRNKAVEHRKPLADRLWVKILAALVTAALVFGICLLISNRLSPREDYAELPQETETPEHTPSTEPIVMTPAPSATSTPTPTPTEEPTPSPSSTPSSYLTPDTLATPEKEPATQNCEQMLLLDSTGSTGSLMYYEKDADGWHLIMTCGATLGKNGVSNNKKEGDNTTPSGEYPLLFVYGEAKPISQLPFHKLTSDSVWVDDSRSKYYNTLQSTGTADRDWTSCEAVYDRYFKGGTHKACIYVGYNGDGLTPGTATAGKGSMITICGKTDSLSPTAGCIDIFNTDMTKLLQYLDPNRNPVIIID